MQTLVMMQRKTYGRSSGKSRKPLQSLPQNCLFDQLLGNKSPVDCFSETVFCNNSSSNSSTPECPENVLFQSPLRDHDKSASEETFIKTSIFANCSKNQKKSYITKRKRRNKLSLKWKDLSDEKKEVNWQEIANQSLVTSNGKRHANREHILSGKYDSATLQGKKLWSPAALDSPFVQCQGIQTSTPNEAAELPLSIEYLAGVSPLFTRPCRVVLSPLSTIVFDSVKKKRHSVAIRKVLCPALLQQSYWLDDPKSHIFELCEQDKALSFSSLFPKKGPHKFRKIGEGSYAEVFCSLSHVLKIIPIQEGSKAFTDILSEIVISKELSRLANSQSFLCANFIQCQRVSYVRGKYPKNLVKEWKAYALRKGSENDCPTKYSLSQLYVVFHMANGGVDLELYQFADGEQMVSVFVQVAVALAVAEEAVEFEHRDLHWGNVLVAPTTQEQLRYCLHGNFLTFPTRGVFASIVDFTLSRLLKDGCVFYTDLSEDPELFDGRGDCQFDVYREMRRFNRNNWSKFEPMSNILWLHYLLQKMTGDRRYPRRPKEALSMLQSWRQRILQYTSAMNFFQCVLRAEMNFFSFS